MNIVSLHYYPVKSLHGISLDEAKLEPWGMTGDRRWVVTDETGKFLTQRKIPVMATIHALPNADGLALQYGSQTLFVPFPAHGPDVEVQVWSDVVRACDAGDAAAEWLSGILGRDCRLVHMDQPQVARPGAWEGHDYHVSFADAFPLLVCNTASLQDLNGRLEHAVPMARFRPNIVVDGDIAWDEDRWAALRIGDVELPIVKPCSRCVMTTVDQDRGEIPHKGEPLRTLTRFRRREAGVLFGQNALISGPATLFVGDRVEIVYL